MCILHCLVPLVFFLNLFCFVMVRVRVKVKDIVRFGMVFRLSVVPCINSGV